MEWVGADTAIEYHLAALRRPLWPSCGQKCEQGGFLTTDTEFRSTARTDGRTTTESAKTAKELSQVGFAQVRNDFLQSRALNAGQELNQRKISGLLCSVDRVLVLA